MSQQSFLLVLILLYLWTLRCVIQVLQDSCLSVRRLACYPDGSNKFWENLFINLYNRFLAFKNVFKRIFLFLSERLSHVWNAGRGTSGNAVACECDEQSTWGDAAICRRCRRIQTTASNSDCVIWNATATRLCHCQHRRSTKSSPEQGNASHCNPYRPAVCCVLKARVVIIIVVVVVIN